jgi:hypothetical protein
MYGDESVEICPVCSIQEHIEQGKSTLTGDRHVTGQPEKVYWKEEVDV